tara:strand:- start:208 stop:1002 length:795 start_codon:yes stop_codon:yes gene_type:complete
MQENLAGMGESPYMSEQDALRAELRESTLSQQGRFMDPARLAFAAAMMEGRTVGQGIAGGMKAASPYMQQAQMLSSQNERQLIMDQLASLEFGARADRDRRGQAMDMTSAEAQEKYQADTLSETALGRESRERMHAEREASTAAHRAELSARAIAESVVSERIDSKRLAENKRQFDREIKRKEQFSAFDQLLKARGMDQDIAKEMRSNKQKIIGHAIDMIDVDQFVSLDEETRIRIIREQFTSNLNLVVDNMYGHTQTQDRTAR